MADIVFDDMLKTFLTDNDNNIYTPVTLSSLVLIDDEKTVNDELGNIWGQLG